MKTSVEIIEKTQEEIADFKVYEVTNTLQNVLTVSSWRRKWGSLQDSFF